MGAFLIAVLEFLAAVYVLRLAIEQGEAVTGSIFEYLWRGIEVLIHKVLGRKIEVSGPSRMGGWIRNKVAGWLSFAVMTVAEPFIQIIRSWFPAQESDEVKADKADAADSLEEKPKENTLQVAVRPTPTDVEYLEALRRLGLNLKSSKQSAIKAREKHWSFTVPGNAGFVPQMADDLRTAWSIICQRKGWPDDGE